MYEIFMLLLSIAILLVLPALAVLVFSLFYESKTIYPWERGLLYVGGQFRRELKPGRHIFCSPAWLFRGFGRKAIVVSVNMNDREVRSRLVDVTGADRLPFKLSAVILYRVTNAHHY